MNIQLLRAEDVLRCGGPYGDCELWDGIAMVREPSGGEAEFVAAEVVGSLQQHVRHNNVRGNRLGWVFSSQQGFLLARDPDRLLASDGAYVSRERLRQIPKRGFVEVVPDFLIEVRSPTDAWEGVVEKCGLWIAHGAACVWAIDPLDRVVAEFRQGRDPVVHRHGVGTATAAPVLPDFSIDLEHLFADLAP